MLSNSAKNNLVNSLIRNSDSAEVLGSGGFGDVYKVDYMVVKKMHLTGEDDVKSFKKELAAWNVFSENPELSLYMPKFLGSSLKKTDKPPMPRYENMMANRNKYIKNSKAWMNSSEPDYYGFIIQTYVPVIDLGEFTERFNTNKKFNFETGYALFNNLIRAFEVLHDSGYIHRDIKPGNILIRTEGDMTMPIIIDFGMVCKLPCELENLCTSNNFSPNGSSYFLPQNMLSQNDRFDGFKKAFPVKPKQRSYFNTLKNTVFCRRRQTRKGPNSVKVETKNVKIRGFYNVASDNYALGLTLEDLVKVIYWDKNPAEKRAALESIARLKSQILPYLTAATAKKIGLYNIQ